MAQLGVVERATIWTAKQIQKRIKYSPDNQFLEGPFAPVREERTDTDLRVTGELPVELNGLYARIGPNPIDVANPSLYHWFIGDGMVHGLRLREGKAQWYRNRWIGSTTVNKALGRPDAPGKRHGVNDSVNTNIIGQGGRLWALVEAGAMPVEVSSELETIRHSYFESDRSCGFTAHPHLDPATGDLHAICYDALVTNRIQYVTIDANCAVKRVVDIPVNDGPMIHDCAITASKVVILDLPVTFTRRGFVTGSTFPFAWNGAHPARVGLLPHDGAATDVRWFSVDPCYVFHTCNAYDREDGSVVLDVVVHPTMFDRSRQGPDSDSTTFERWTLDPKTSSVHRAVISDLQQEFPRYDERQSTKANRYAYTVGLNIGRKTLEGTASGDPLLRHDLEKGTTVAHDFGPGRITAEAVFVPRSPGAAEDDGWLISYVYDVHEGRSDLVILNANDLGGEPQAIVHLPAAVPLGFHGNWIADPA